jgi:ABC-type Mn2+/Zn2+ transport system permease subunit
VPAATASNFSTSMRQMFRWTFLLSVLTGLIGVYISWHTYLRMGTGPPKQFGLSGTIVCVGVVGFVLSMGLRLLRRKFAHLG